MDWKWWEYALVGASGVLVLVLVTVANHIWPGLGVSPVVERPLWGR